jgi:hypothetical protein
MLDNIYSTHSTEVEMWLDCGEHGKASLRRITPNSVVLREPLEAPPCHADLVIRVDGKMLICRVDVISGLSKNRMVALVLPIDNIAPI